MAALLVCVGCFIGYMWYNIKHADDEDREDFVAEIQKQAIEHGLISLSGAFEEILKQADVVQKDEGWLNQLIGSIKSKTYLFEYIHFRNEIITS